MKKSKLKQIIREEIQRALNEEGSVIWSPLEMIKIYKLMKSKGYEVKVNEGNMFNIKTISVGIPGAGIMLIARDGNLYGDSLWGADVRTVDELLKKIEDFKKDQKHLNQ